MKTRYIQISIQTHLRAEKFRALLLFLYGQSLEKLNFSVRQTEKNTLFLRSIVQQEQQFKVLNQICSDFCVDSIDVSFPSCVFSMSREISFSISSFIPGNHGKPITVLQPGKILASCNRIAILAGFPPARESDLSFFIEKQNRIRRIFGGRGGGIYALYAWDANIRARFNERGYKVFQIAAWYGIGKNLEKGCGEIKTSENLWLYLRSAF